EAVDGGADQLLGRLPVRDVAEVRERAAAGLLDLLDHRPPPRLVAARAVDAGAEVVHDDRRAEPGEPERVQAPEPGPRPGDDRDLPLELPRHRGPTRAARGSWRCRPRHRSTSTRAPASRRGARARAAR